MREGGFHFKVAPGRCDPPWVTLAESDLVFPFHGIPFPREGEALALPKRLFLRIQLRLF